MAAPPVCYSYDARTGEYLGAIATTPDPLEPNRFVEPAFTALIAPPSAQAGHALVWSGGAWAQVEDHRGETWYLGESPLIVQQIGDPTTFVPPLSKTAPEIVPAPPTSCTKLGLKRAFSEMGLWDKVKAFIASDTDRQEEWDLATELKLSDPIMVAAIQAFALSGISIDPVQLATRANELVS
jgi:hypothetical protein